MIDLDAVRAAAQKAQRVLGQTQRADGSWDWPNDLGSFVSAQALVALEFVGRLDAADGKDGARWLAAQQLPDGSFGGRPFATAGDLGATASAWAAFHACGLGDDDGPLQKARAWVEAHGGVPAVIANIATGDVSALFLAMVGLADPKAMPAPPLFLTLIPPIEELLEKKLNTGVLMMLAQNGALIRYLRGDWGEHGDKRGWFASLECKRALALIDLYQNPDGSWNSNAAQQVVAIPALVALGVAPDDGRLQRAIDWLLAQRVRDAGGLWFASFMSSVWTTALAVRALLHSGVPCDDEKLAQALDWLCRAQIQVPQPLPSQPRKDAPRTGGYAFEGPGNVTMPDCDDTGVALGPMAMALAHTGAHGVQADRAERVRLACMRARDWLFGMQNSDGGWPSYQWGMPGKPRGPIMTRPLVIPVNDPIAMAKLIVSPPIEFGDPSAEDATARILFGLGQLGLSPTAPVIASALEFLETQQLDNGAWWGRWMVNYCAATACVLEALESVGADLTSPMVERAVAFLKAHQNADGGWGEGVDTYADPSRAGVGPSMPPVAGMVVTALVAVGEGASDAVARGVEYLVAAQRSDGTWSNADWLHAYLPPQSFYYLPGEPRYYTLEALGRYLAFSRGADVERPGDETAASVARTEGAHAPASGDGAGPTMPARLPSGAWNPAFLAAMRNEGDALADAVVREIFNEGDQAAVDDVFAKITRSDEPIPPGLPKRALAYFESTAALPPWADKEQIATAQRMFTRDGWATAAALFTSSLPQAYAARNGARVLIGTTGMIMHVERRIFETAQFVFDVLDEGAFGPAGRGLRAAQKVRLLHATIRHLTLRQAGWDPRAWGVPINQEDLAGTLMTFSCVVLDALRKLRVGYSDDEREAFLHAWKVVGHFMGVDERLLPRDVADGDALMESIRTTEWQASPEGAQLAAALVKMMQSFLPGRAFEGLPIAMMRELAGDHCADLLSLPPAGWTRRLVHAAEDLDQLLGKGDDHSLVGRLLADASHKLMEGLVGAFREGKQTKFRIPDALVHAWSLAKD
ncbi:MAG TPA: oxygenase MpaB family protein [Polyangia bacterium]|jgi:squalene cyclase